MPEVLEMTTVITDHDEIVRRWQEASPKDLAFPPNCFLHMEGRFVEWNFDENTLTARFPCKEEFYNPRKFMQGGFVVAALDNVLGPLSYLTGSPSVTTQLNTSFVRPVTPTLEYVEVKAVIHDKTTTKVYSSAEARSPTGKLLTSVQATSHIVG